MSTLARFQVLLFCTVLLSAASGCQRDSGAKRSDGTSVKADIPSAPARARMPRDDLNKLPIYLGARFNMWKSSPFYRLDLKGGPPRKLTTKNVLILATNGLRPPPHPGGGGKTFQCYLDELPVVFGGRPVRGTSMVLIRAPDDGRDLVKSVVWCCDEYTRTWDQFQQQMRDAQAGARGAIRLGDGERLSFEMLPPRVVGNRVENNRALDGLIERVLDDVEAGRQEL